MGMKHAKHDYFISLTSRWQFYTTPVCCRFMLRVVLFSEMPKYTEQMLQNSQTAFSFHMPMISHICISQIAGECYSFNTPPIACQGARQLMCSSQFMIFKLLPLIPQYFEQPGSCTNPTKAVSHISTFKYHLLYLFWFSTSLALWAFHQQKIVTGTCKHQCEEWVLDVYRFDIPVVNVLSKPQR